uniref:DUF38 domain-containing protein n=1 Tax=Panagrolaimus davidi TaxID=227884 RepID=A0A914QTV2_9BILA
MDLSMPSNSSISRSNRKRKAQDSNVVLSKRERKREKCHKFYSTYKRQNFSMPDSVMFYMAKNPKTAEMYQKMIQICKYFFIKNPILVIPSLVYDGKKWRESRSHVFFDLSKTTSKFWITEGIEVALKKVIVENPVSSLIPKLFRCNAKNVVVANQEIYYHDIRHLLPSAEKIIMMNVTVKYENGFIVALENIVEIAVKAKKIQLYSTHLNITSKTMKELLQIPHFATLDLFRMDYIPETFDLDTFYSYMKQNKLTKFCLVFNHSISAAYINQLEAIFNEIYETKIHGYNPAIIRYPGVDNQKYNRLFFQFTKMDEFF